MKIVVEVTQNWISEGAKSMADFACCSSLLLNEFSALD